MIELELKARVADPELLRRRLRAAGAAPGFAGRMEDRRYDQGGRLLRGDEVLRVRRFVSAGGAAEVRISWKGPGSIRDGYKARPELEVRVAGGDPAALVEALGYEVTARIDRLVEYFEFVEATVRLERYPRMDVLVEVEGSPEGIEAAVAATGIARTEFSADSLTGFVARYESREGRPAVLSLEGPGALPPEWASP